MNEIKTQIKEFQQWLESILKHRVSLLPENDIAQKRIKNAISHSLLGNAKRIRPFIIVKSCEMYGISREEVINLLVAIEYIHCYSLIHDDMPCMDNSDERRGKPALHKVYGDATALLTGNSLVSLAFDEILSESFQFENYIKIHLMQSLSKAIGYHGMMAGQMLDLLIVQDRNSTTEEFIHMNKLKTGELFAFCFSAGAMLKQNSHTIQDLQNIGYDIGYIFQLVDDILDVTEDLGKNQGEVFAKKTFIAHIGGMSDAKQHLFMIAQQAKSKISRVAKQSQLSYLIDHIINQLQV